MKGHSVFDKFGGHPGRTLWYLLVITARVQQHVSAVSFGFTSWSQLG